jgi:DNA transposition AAA+ family ATPase
MVKTIERNGVEAAVSSRIPSTDRAMQAEASSAHSRINVPLNLDNWKTLPENVVAELTWFHQHLLDNNLSWTEAEQAISYDRSTVFRVLKGTYEGSWQKIVAAIASYRKLDEQRGSIQKNEFVENSISRLIFAALDYTMANNSLAMIVGESRSGKTMGAKMWCQMNNHGRAVFITAPVVGGTKALARRIAKRVGVNRNQSVPTLIEAIYRAFNKNRILVVDEAHRLLPNDSRVVNPNNVEILRDIHDETGCALALISTRRLQNGLERGAYQYEQLTGRLSGGMPFIIKPKIKRGDVVPIVKQFVKNPSTGLIDDMEKIANAPGRLGVMVEMLKVASRIASKSKQSLDESHVHKAIAIRAQMSGGGQ